MSQIPPPPPGQPTPSGGQSNVGSNKNLYTILAWALLPPIGSLIFLFVGKDDPDVKYNAAEALIIHGVCLVISIILFVFLLPIYPIWQLVWFVVWLVGLIMALQANGARVNYPVLGPVVAQYVPMVESWAK
ncbi:MAG TPA: hypothetical protein VLR46_02020 [Candidatus Dormibacteraeota bacterium]|nr:hypothetical protein [Candidatus Dormibacteraeota bacterium]